MHERFTKRVAGGETALWRSTARRFRTPWSKANSLDTKKAPSQALSLKPLAASKPLIEEQKKQGMIMDYKVFLKQTKNSPEDWDICVAIEYKNYAAMDGLAAKGEMLRDKILGGKAPAQQLADKRAEIREVISSELLQEIILK